MESRLGVCSSCQAQFKVPATFTAARAKCKNCGGVVEIGEAKSAKPSAPASTAKPPPPAAKPPAVPAVKPPALASAASPAKAPPRAPSAPASVPARASSPASAPRPKPASPKASAKVEAIASSAKGASERVNKAASEATARLRSGEARQSARARSTRAAPKKNNMALIGGIAFLVLAAGGFGFWKWKSSSSEPSTEPGAILAADKGSTPAAPGQTTPSAQPAAAGSQASKADGAAKVPAEAAAPAKEASADGKQGEKKPKAEAVAGDPNSINLAAYPDQAPLEETNPERAEELKTLAVNLVDTDNPRAGTKAKPKLVEAGKEAIPFLLNQFKAQDVSVELGMRNGDLIQRTLTEICRGYNFGWKYTLESKDVYFNKKAIEAWIKAFDKARVDPEFWAKMSKQGQVEREKAESAAEAKVDAASEEKREDF